MGLVNEVLHVAGEEFVDDLEVRGTAGLNPELQAVSLVPCVVEFDLQTLHTLVKGFLSVLEQIVGFLETQDRLVLQRYLGLEIAQPICRDSSRRSHLSIFYRAISKT